MPVTHAPERPFVDFEVVLDPGRWDADVALIGIAHGEPYAFDEVPNDQSRAPDAVRRQSDLFCYGGGRHFDFDLGGDLASLLPARRIDCGNLARGAESYAEYATRARGALERLWRGGAQVFVLGGDHGVTIPVLEALEAVGERLYIVHIDAHLDWRTEVGGVRHGYSSPLYWASTKRCVAGMTQIGLRGTGSARAAEVAAARTYGSRLYTARAVREHGFGPVLESIPTDLPLYITIDADGLDPAEMPGVMAPAPGGLAVGAVVDFLATLARRQRILGLDVVEIAPRFDAGNAITCIAAGRLIVATLGHSWAPGGGRRGA
ncbi:MAG: arginase family protein [Proteobacteria bacterium]|nr:arginase family protein [Pseudomonadota bacterium]